MRRSIVLLLAAALLAGCGSESSLDSREPVARAPRVRTVDNVLELRAAFNEDAGKARLLLILSPT
jgi:hypothetical protein